jgi:hypothetical protein
VCEVENSGEDSYLENKVGHFTGKVLHWSIALYGAEI